MVIGPGSLGVLLVDYTTKRRRNCLWWGHPGKMALIDRWLLWPKYLYFLLNFCVYSSYHFSFKYLREKWNVSDSAYGMLNSLTAISFLASIFWTTLADRTKSYRVILSLAAALYGLSFSLLYFGEGWFDEKNSSLKTAFLATSFLLTNISISALYPILDNRIMVLLSQRSVRSKDLFGRQRLWGCLGQSAVGLVTAYAIESVGFTGMFVILSLSCVLFIISIVLFLTTQFKNLPVEIVSADSKNDKPKDDQKEQQQQDNAANKKSPFILLITNARFLLLLLLVLIGGLTRGIVGNYLQQYLERYFNFDPVEYASYTMSRLLTEIGAFFIGKPLLELFGAETLLIFGIIAGMIRVGAYGFMPMSPKWKMSIPVVELLKGLNAAFIVVGGTRIAHDIAPIGTEATAQGFFSGIHGNLSNAFSGLFGSFIIQLFRDEPLAMRYLFQISTFITLGSCLVYSIFIFFKKQ